VAIVVVAMATLGAACGRGDDEATAPLTRPWGPDEVVVQVTVAGGFVPVDVAVTVVPVVTVLGDGTVITPAPVTAIYPGPAMAPLQSVTVPQRTVDDLVQRAGDLGLLDGPLEFGQPPVADAPDTVVTIVTGGRTHSHTANALGLEGVAAGPRSGVSERAAANRQALQAFVDATRGLPPGESAWTPESVVASVLGEYRPEPELPQVPRPWPLAQPPITTGATFPCTLVAGADTPVLLEALARANARTPWLVDGTAYSIAFRPVVPGQPGCPG
jgi:hypothetical protein